MLPFFPSPTTKYLLCDAGGLHHRAKHQFSHIIICENCSTDDVRRNRLGGLDIYLLGKLIIEPPHSNIAAVNDWSVLKEVSGELMWPSLI